MSCLHSEPSLGRHHDNAPSERAAKMPKERLDVPCIRDIGPGETGWAAANALAVDEDEGCYLDAGSPLTSANNGKLRIKHDGSGFYRVMYFDSQKRWRPGPLRKGRRWLPIARLEFSGPPA